MLTRASGALGDGPMWSVQVDTPWRKAVTKLEGEEAYEDLNKLDRLEVFQEYIL